MGICLKSTVNFKYWMTWITVENRRGTDFWAVKQPIFPESQSQTADPATILIIRSLSQSSACGGATIIWRSSVVSFGPQGNDEHWQCERQRKLSFQSSQSVCTTPLQNTKRHYRSIFQVQEKTYWVIPRQLTRQLQRPPPISLVCCLNDFF